MNTETVNELIATLESAGELSIREQEFLKLAKEFRICSASLDAAIKTGNMLADQNAQLAAENAEAKKIISECREYFIAGVMNRIRPTNEGYLHMICDTFADETPATDRIVAGIKADGRAEGVNFAASRLAAAFNHGFVDKPMAEVGDVVRMILTAKEDLANDPVLAADGLSGEYAEKSLAEWETELREGADK
ncbi:TPA: hypothetical protein ACPUHY_002677 [Klebsiella pneumoniae]